MQLDPLPQTRPRWQRFGCLRCFCRFYLPCLTIRSKREKGEGEEEGREEGEMRERGGRGEGEGRAERRAERRSERRAERSCLESNYFAGEDPHGHEWR